MKKSILLVVACSVISLSLNAQNKGTGPGSGWVSPNCSGDNDPVYPAWNYVPYKVFIACPEVKVGIGTNSPKYELDVHNTGRFYNVFSTNISLGEYESPLAHLINGRFRIITNTSYGYAINVSSVTSNLVKPLFRVSNKGAVTVYNKSTSPALIIYKNDGTKAIQVDNNGTLHARQIEVDEDAWPDYVFEKGYQLMSLEELAVYIIKNKHLPNIPSAVNVGKNGLNLGKMQKLLMEKVEELTIYTIQQNNQIKQLEKENQKLKDELSALRKDVDDIKAMLNK